MVYYYVCELQPTSRSDITWGPDTRGFTFRLSLPKVDHDDKIEKEKLQEDVKFIADGPTDHFEDRFNVVADYALNDEEPDQEKKQTTKKKIRFGDFTVTKKRMPEVTLVANYLIEKHGITNNNDLSTAVYSTLKDLKKNAASILKDKAQTNSLCFQYLFHYCFWASGY